MSYRSDNLDLTDPGVADALVSLFDGDWRYVHDMEKWIEWRGARWEDDERERVMQIAIANVERMEASVDAIEGDRARKAARKSWLERMSAGKLLSSLRIARSDPTIAMLAEGLDADPLSLHVANGRIALGDGKLHAPDRRWLNSRLANVDFDPAATSETWDAFINAVTCGDKTLARWLQHAVGMSLIGDQREQVILFCHGNGANGKTTFLEAVSHALGDYAAQGAPDLVTESRNDRHPTELFDLRGKRLVVVPELRGNRALDESKIKMLASGGHTKGRRMGKDFVEFPNTWQLWLDGNAKPTITGQDEGIWRRMRLVPWKMHLTADQRDRELPDRLREAAPAILAWAVRGCVEYLRAGKLPPCVSVDVGTETYRREQDLVGEWLSEIHAVDRWQPVPGAWATAAAVTRSATEWCERNNVRPWSPQRLAQELQRRGCDPERKRVGRGWSGIEQDAVERRDYSTPPQRSVWEG